MKKLGELKPPKGATHPKKRLGFGESSGHGKTSGKGQKGQRARSGPGLRPEFEGGQTPLVRRIPKRGFSHYRREPVQVVNLGSLSRFPKGAIVDPQALASAGLLGTARHSVKVLGDGELSHALIVKAHRFSESALRKIAAAGGTAEVLKA